MTIIERRIFIIGAWLVLGGTLLALILFGWRYGFGFLAGGALAALSLAWLRKSVDALLFKPRRKAETRAVVGFILRLLLIPMGLYAIIRFLYGGIIAAVAGFAIFNFSVFIEGVYEALKSSGKNARIQ
jgi:MFS family permease